jgi:AcrR family transcriptional regulator
MYARRTVSPPLRARKERRPPRGDRAAGRPRDERIDTEVVAAVLHTLRTRGYRAVTIEGVARIAKRARSSIYRRWRSKRDLVAYAVLSAMGERPAADTGHLRKDLAAAAGTLLNAFAGPLGQALAGLVADMAQDAGLARTIRSEVLAARRSSMREAFDRARARRESRDDLDIELVLDMLTGPFYYRALFGHAPLTKRMTGRVVSYVLRVAAPPRAVPLTGRSRALGAVRGGRCVR